MACKLRPGYLVAQKGRYITIRGKRWKMIIGRPPVNKASAYCEPNLKTIWIHPDWAKDPDRRYRCIVHEILHACFYDLREEAVEEAEDAIAAALEMSCP